MVSTPTLPEQPSDSVPREATTEPSGAPIVQPTVTQKPWTLRIPPLKTKEPPPRLIKPRLSPHPEESMEVVHVETSSDPAIRAERKRVAREQLAAIRARRGRMSAAASREEVQQHRREHIDAMAARRSGGGRTNAAASRRGGYRRRRGTQ